MTLEKTLSDWLRDLDVPLWRLRVMNTAEEEPPPDRVEAQLRDLSERADAALEWAQARRRGSEA